MDYKSLQDELNFYGKWLSHAVYLEYRDDFGVEDDLYLFSKTEEDFIQIRSDVKDEVFIFQDECLYCYPNCPSLKGFTLEKKKEYLKKLLPFYVFSFVIRPNYQKDHGFQDFMTKGLIEVYVEAFSLRYQILFVTRYEKNKEFVSSFLGAISPSISVHKMVFQNDLEYMIEMYQIHTGHNLYKKYLDEIHKDDISVVLLSKKNGSFGFFHGVLVIISCILLGFLLVVLLSSC